MTKSISDSYNVRRPGICIHVIWNLDPFSTCLYHFTLFVFFLFPSTLSSLSGNKYFNSDKRNMNNSLLLVVRFNSLLVKGKVGCYFWVFSKLTSGLISTKTNIMPAKLRTSITNSCLSQRPRGRKRRSAAPYLLELRVQIPPGAWIAVYCECCQLEVSATGWSLVQRIPTKCDVSECHLETSTRTPRPIRALAQWKMLQKMLWEL
jgi:hypothetical protein